MPRGEHLKKIRSDEIVAGLDSATDSYGRPLVTPSEIAQNLPETAHQVTPEAIRQRLHKMDDVEKVEIGGAVLWKRTNARVWADESAATGMAGFGVAGGTTSAPALKSWITAALPLLGAILAFVANMIPALGIGVGAAYHFADADYKRLRPSEWRENERVFLVWSGVVGIVVLGTEVVIEELTGGTMGVIPDVNPDVYITYWVVLGLAGLFIVGAVAYLAARYGARQASTTEAKA